MRIALLISVLMCFAGSSVAEEYSNPEYGIVVRTEGNWRITNSAKLRIDLKSLSDAQLAELFAAYDQSGVVGLSDQEDAQRPKIQIQMRVSRRGQISALELADGYSSTGASRRNVVPATEMSIGGVPGAYSAVTHTNMARPSTLHHFIVKRSRSYIVVTAWLSSGGLDAQLATIKEALSDWQIDLSADKPEP